VDYFMLFVLACLSFLLIVVVLLQRGRGGGLAGALGGAGGQSAFGTKAGDVFTKITVGLAVIWVLVAGISIQVLSNTTGSSFKGGKDAVPTLEPGPDDKAEEGLQAPKDQPPVKEDKLAPPKKEETKTPEAGTKVDGEKKTEAPVKTEEKPVAEKPAPAKTEPAKPETKSPEKKE